jgi:hypothetical protein
LLYLIENITRLDDRGKSIIKHCCRTSRDSLRGCYFDRIRLIMIESRESNISFVQSIANNLMGSNRGNGSVDAKKIPSFLILLIACHAY